MPRKGCASYELPSARSSHGERAHCWPWCAGVRLLTRDFVWFSFRAADQWETRPRSAPRISRDRVPSRGPVPDPYAVRAENWSGSRAEPRTGANPYAVWAENHPASRAEPRTSGRHVRGLRRELVGFLYRTADQWATHPRFSTRTARNHVPNRGPVRLRSHAWSRTARCGRCSRQECFSMGSIARYAAMLRKSMVQTM